MHVLVIDDDQDFCHLLATHLQRKGHEVTVTNDGIQGQRMARLDSPDVITVDYQMPAASGLTVLRRLRANSATSMIPVVILSGSLTDDIINEASSHGAHRVLSKLTLTETSLVEALESAIDATADISTIHPLFPGSDT
jgi:two-component system phosphate regulon response regulator PhoB